MAIPATVVWQVQNGGSDTQCGGGFSSALGGTDYSQQNAAQATGTVTSSTTTVTATTAIFTAAMVGNIITDGTTYKYITAFTSSTIITVDSAPTWTAATIFVGGALATPGKAGSLATVAGQQVAIAYSASVYSITNASTNIAGGCVLPTAGTTYFGYNTTRSPNNSDALLPTLQLQSGVSAATIFGAAVFTATNLILDGNLQTTSKGQATAASMFIACTFKNFTSGATGSSGYMISCLFTGNTTSVVVSTNAYNCVATGNTVSAFGFNAIDCIAYSNTGASTDGFSAASVVENCVAYNNGRDGFHMAGSCVLYNCSAESNGGFGFNCTASSGRMVLINCSSFGNTTARINTATLPTQDVGGITTAASAFVNPGSGNFALNTTTGAGALLRAAGYPTSFPGGLTANYRDVGATQHQDPATTTHGIIVGG